MAVQKPARKTSKGVNRFVASVGGVQLPAEAADQLERDIRKAVLAQEGLSVNAQNCKIICRDGVVTLRGVVASESESQVIQAKAASVPGVTSVSNQLEVRVQ